MIIHPAIENAYKVLNGEALTKAEALTLISEINGGDILDLVSLAHKVQEKFAPNLISCSILNAKSGRCSQNCRFCAQSGHHHTNIETYPILSQEEVVEAARKVYEAGVRSFGYVTSGCGYTTNDREFQQVLATIDALHAEFPDLRICMSIGILSRDTAKLLSEHDIARYNMNLQTAPAKYSKLIADTHTIEEKIQTIKYLQEFGVEICCGGIIGLGESAEDRVEMAYAVKELNVEGIPLNVLLPIPGTPLEKLPVMEPAEVAKAFAIFRLVNPDKQIKFADGRETTMKDFQGLLMLSGMNSIITGGYLTTRGRSVAEDKKLFESLAFFK